MSIIAGATFLAREEAIVFMIPMSSMFLLATKVNWRKWVLCYAIIILGFVPQLVIKQQVLGSVVSTGRVSKKSGSLSYTDVRSRYLQPNLFKRNLKQTIINSGPGSARPALLQEAPWLAVGFLGLVFVMFSKRYPFGLKLFILSSAGLTVFYLSGNNMSAVKLSFHALRYVSPALIVLNLGLVIAVREVSRLAESVLKREKSTLA
jgi:hypothetical protein